METLVNSYVPKEGSKAAIAIKALGAGAMSVPELAKILGEDARTLYPALHRPIHEYLIVKAKDADGLMYFALPGQELPDGLTPYDTKVVGAGISSGLSKAMVNPDDPFGLVAKKNGKNPPAAQHQSRASEKQLNDRARTDRVAADMFAQGPIDTPPLITAKPGITGPDSAPLSGPIASNSSKPNDPRAKNEEPAASAPRTKLADHFACALFSTGELLIEQGYNSVKLSPENYATLQAYTARFKDIP